MTEIERMLRDTLTRMEQDVSAQLASRDKTVEEQRRALAALGRELQRLQEENDASKADVQALTRRLQSLSDAYNSLEPLLTRLSGILNGK
jgi:chromosome segregation ATPase